MAEKKKEKTPQEKAEDAGSVFGGMLGKAIDALTKRRKEMEKYGQDSANGKKKK